MTKVHESSREEIFRKFKRKNIAAFILLAFIILSTTTTVYYFNRVRSLKNKAAEVLETKKLTRDAFVPGEVIFKLKSHVGLLREKSNIKSSGISINSQPISLLDLDESTLPMSLKKLSKKDTHVNIVKVFKDFENPEKEIIKFKTKFANTTSASGRINEKNAVSIDLSRVYKVIFDPKVPLITILTQLAADKDIEYAEPNYILNISLVPNDPYYLDQNPPASERALPSTTTGYWNPPYDYQWGLKKIDAEKAWDTTTGNQSIIVAVIDTGVDYTHPDLKDRVILGKDFSNTDDDPMDDHGHGTHVAGIINAIGNNAQGIAGVSWNTKILAIKGLSSSGSGSITTLSAAIDYARQNGARVINASWGGMGTSQTLKDAIALAYQYNIVFVAAAGNSGADSRLFQPASFRETIAVGSSDIDDNKSDFSNHTGIDLLAPGGNSSTSDAGGNLFRNILSLRAHDTGAQSLTVGTSYLRQAGTSMAAPFVAGAASLLLSANESFEPEQARSILRTSTDTKDEHVWTKNSGYGRLNVGRALTKHDNVTISRILSPDYTTPSADLLNLTFISYGKSFHKWVLDYGLGLDPSQWTTISEATEPAIAPYATLFNTSAVTQGDYTIRLRTLTSDLTVSGSEDRLILQKTPNEKWRVYPTSGNYFAPPTIADIDNDGINEVLVTTNFSELYILGNDGSFKKTIRVAPQVFTFLSETVVVADILLQVSGKEILVTTEDANGNSYLRIFENNGSEYVNGSWPVLIGNSPLETRVVSPRVEDIDGDGVVEILAGRGNQVFILKNDGSPFNDHWPKTLDGLVDNSVFAGYFQDSKRNNLQILVVTNKGNGYVYDMYGTEIFSFAIPVADDYIDLFQTPSVVIGDLDNDGQQEIIAKYHYDNKRNIDIALYRSDGTLGWKKHLGNGGFIDTFAVPILSDVNGDGVKEILVSDSDNLYTLDKDGNEVSDWPVFPWQNILNFVSGDTNGDGIQEIYFSLAYPPSVGKMQNGSLVYSYSFPGILAYTNPTIGDLDNDGSLDLVMHASFGYPLIAYDLGKKETQKSLKHQWPQYQHDEMQRSAGDICIKTYCDMNRDEKEDSADGDFVKSCFGRQWPLGPCRTVDTICDGNVNLLDASKLFHTCALIFETPTPTPSLTPTPTPTPALPSISSFTPPSGYVNATITISGSNFINVNTVKFNGVSANSWNVLSSSTIRAVVPSNATTGPISIQTAIGTANSVSYFKVIPKIFNLSPGSGKTGTNVTIQGTGFLDTASVAFNGKTASFTKISSTVLRATVPAGATTGKVTVTSPGGTATSPTNFVVSK